MDRTSKLRALAAGKTVLAFLAICCTGCRWLASPEGTAAQRRHSLLAVSHTGTVSYGKTVARLEDPDPLVRRAVIQALIDMRPENTLPGLIMALDNPDLVVRRNAALALGNLGPPALTPLKEAVADEQPLVRHAAVCALSRITPRSAEIFNLLGDAAKDEDQRVRAAAMHATDQYLTVVKEVRLPARGWKFRLDKDRAGEGQSWFAPDLDDRHWDDIGIEEAWQKFGYEHIGHAWYRRSFDIPADAPGDRVYLLFDGVDECARIWLNGEYVGEHDLGPGGWNKPFRFEITGRVRWGERNHIAVCVWNTAAAGGIWRPVRIVAAKYEQ